MRKYNSDFKVLFYFAAFAFLIISCEDQNSENYMHNESQMFSKMDVNAPSPKKEAKKMSIHGDERTDNYYWMRLSDEQKTAETPDAHTAEVLDYLNNENAYASNLMSHTEQLQDELFEEIKGRIKQTDLSVPVKRNGYYYYNKYIEGGEYPIFCRKKGSLDSDEIIMFDANEMAKGHDYYNLGGISVSDNNNIAAYAEDIVSRRIYTIRFKNLNTGKNLEDVLTNTTGGTVWANDNKTVFYTVKDDALRSYKIFKHKLGTDQSEDVEVFHESDETFSCYVYKSKSKKYIIIGSYHTLMAEYRYVDADTPDDDFTIFQERTRNLEHSIAHYGDKWYIRTNKDAKNFRIMSCGIDKTNQSNWEEVIPHRNDVLVEYMDIFKDHLVIGERVDGISQIRVKAWEGDDHYIEFPEKAFIAYTSANPEFDTDILRIGYQSMTTPNSIFDYNMNSKDRELLKQQEVLGDFDQADYESKRVFATARDGARVPISIVYKKGTPLDGSSPCLLYGYGSYGNSMNPSFSSARLSLLNRGFVYAIAHIRGGEEMGRHWYEDGKKFKKKNTFTDFIDCGKHLIAENYADENRLFAMGGSAGGLLVGAVINMEPDMWKGVIAAVPFVDVVTTMLDESIPLTTGEWDEWGNPADAEYYKYMLSYSPYDNIEEKNYPPLLVTTGLHDSQVQYWEPAKWVAKLRDMKTDNNPLLLKTEMEAGHGGQSGRFRRLKEVAMEYAFFVDLAGLNETVKD